MKAALLHDIRNKVAECFSIIELLYIKKELGEDARERLLKKLKAMLGLMDTLAQEISGDIKGGTVISTEAIRLHIIDCLSDFPGKKLVTLTTTGRGLYVNADLDALCLVFREIGRNAEKAGAKTITAYITSRGNTVKLVFTNDGGMDFETLENIGFGYSSSGGGKGVTLIRSLVHGLGGTVQWVSDGVNTIVSIKLPKSSSI